MRRIFPPIPVLAAFLAGLVVAGTAGTVAQEASPSGGGAAISAPPIAVMLRDATGTEVGTASLGTQADGRVAVAVAVRAGALAPGEHGIHVHEVGVCDPSGAEPFASAGAHYNPTGAAHGGPDAPEAHAGDLGNLVAGADGSATLTVATDRFTLEPGPAMLQDADGSALVIHAERDDLRTDPSGNSGGRVLCGVAFTPASAGTPIPGTPAPASPVASPSAASPVASSAAAVAVEVRDFAFVPPALTVPVGATVTWTNRDSAFHTATGDDGGFSSGALSQGQTFAQTFDAAGSFAYHCDFHPFMTATVTVE